jgi:hypothetical protein
MRRAPIEILLLYLGGMLALGWWIVIASRRRWADRPGRHGRVYFLLLGGYLLVAWSLFYGLDLWLQWVALLGASVAVVLAIVAR